jgi:hypothetical protein
MSCTMLRHTLLSAFSLTLLLSCSEGPESPIAAEAPSKSFTDADKEIARKLSIGRVASTLQTGTPYDQALRCGLAIDAIKDRFRDMDSVTPEQLKALDQAKAMYDARLKGLGTSSGKTQEDISADIQSQIENGPAAGELILQAIDCIEELERAS